jgi:hypothetical protein
MTKNWNPHYELINLNETNMKNLVSPTGQVQLS